MNYRYPCDQCGQLRDAAFEHKCDDRVLNAPRCVNPNCNRSLYDKKLPCFVCDDPTCVLCADCCHARQQVLDRFATQPRDVVTDGRSLRERIDAAVNELLVGGIEVNGLLPDHVPQFTVRPTTTIVQPNPVKMTVEGETFEVTFEPIEFGGDLHTGCTVERLVLLDFALMPAPEAPPGVILGADFGQIGGDRTVSGMVKLTFREVPDDYFPPTER